MKFSFRSYSNGRTHTRRSPSSAPTTRSSSYHSPTRGIPLNSTQSTGISRPSSPAINMTPVRHSTHTTTPPVRPQPQILSVEQQSPAHHRANSGPTIAISLFPENDSSNCSLFSFFSKVFILIDFFFNYSISISNDSTWFTTFKL